MIINDGIVLAEVSTAYDVCEVSLMANDIETMDVLPFSTDVRFGASDAQYGADEIREDPY